MSYVSDGRTELLPPVLFVGRPGQRNCDLVGVFTRTKACFVKYDWRMTGERRLALRVVHSLTYCFTAILARCNSIWFTREFGILLFRTFSSDLDRNCMCGLPLAVLTWFNLRLCRVMFSCHETPCSGYNYTDTNINRTLLLARVRAEYYKMNSRTVGCRITTLYECSLVICIRDRHLACHG